VAQAGQVRVHSAGVIEFGASPCSLVVLNRCDCITQLDEFVGRVTRKSHADVCRLRGFVVPLGCRWFVDNKVWDHDGINDAEENVLNESHAKQERQSGRWLSYRPGS
jgi:hypothetical protein